MIAREPAAGWRDSDATRAKPAKPCKNGHEDWAWYRPEQRWVCRLDGEYERGGAPPKTAPRPAPAAWPPLDHLLEHDG